MMFRAGEKPRNCKEVQALSDADLKKIITEGKGKMKAVGGLCRTDIPDPIAFVRSLAKK